VIPIHIPPLRDRKEDIPPLCDHFLNKYAKINGKGKAVLSPGALHILNAYHWPGNVRELEHVMERSVLICDEDVILPDHIYLDGPIQLHSEQMGGVVDEVPDLEIKSIAKTPVTLREMEKTMIFDALTRVNGNRTQASRILGISVRTMRNKLQEYEAEGEAIPCDT
jgi:DNA-binding NtrC family response regulator